MAKSPPKYKPQAEYTNCRTNFTDKRKLEEVKVEETLVAEIRSLGLAQERHHKGNSGKRQNYEAHQLILILQRHAPSKVNTENTDVRRKLIPRNTQEDSSTGSSICVARLSSPTCLNSSIAL